MKEYKNRDNTHIKFMQKDLKLCLKIMKWNEKLIKRDEISFELK